MKERERERIRERLLLANCTLIERNSAQKQVQFTLASVKLIAACILNVTWIAIEDKA